MANNHTTTSTTATTTTPPPVKFITGADSNGCTLKDSLISHLNSLHIPVDDLGVGPYYSIADQVARRVSAATDSTTTTTLGLVACGTGVGVGIFANKTPGIYAATCLTVSDAVNARSINNANVLAVSGMTTSPSTAVDILDAFINTPFKSPCPASGNLPWPSDIHTFLDTSLEEMPRIGRQHTPNSSTTADCSICYCVAKDREFTPVEIIPGGMMKIVRESPTSAIIKFKAGSVEPAHHHTFGHDLLVMKGKKTVWNLSKNQKFDLIDGDYLFTPAGDVHRVKYFEDTEFFLKWDGPWDIIMDEDLDSAKEQS